MTLKELQNMIKEEFTAFQNEAEDDVDVSVSDADVDVDMGDDMGAEEAPVDGEEDVLRKIYDLLSIHFGEGGEEMPAEDMGDEDEMGMGDDTDDVEETYMENEEADLEEWTGKNDPKPGGKGTTGYDNKPGGKGSTGYDAGSKALQERFQKLANIIK